MALEERLKRDAKQGSECRRKDDLTMLSVLKEMSKGSGRRRRREIGKGSGGLFGLLMCFMYYLCLWEVEGETGENVVSREGGGEEGGGGEEKLARRIYDHSLSGFREI